MSIEKVVQDLTAAIRELTAVMQGARVAVPATEETAAEEVTTKAAVIDGSPAAALDFVKDIQPKVNAIIAAGKREAVVKIRDHFGVKLSEVKATKYAELMTMLEAAAK